LSQALKTYSKGAPFYNVWVLDHQDKSAPHFEQNLGREKLL